MTETNHSQSIPISPNVFPTKNKKMTEPTEKIYGETVMDIKSKVNEQIDIAMEIYRKDGPVWHTLVMRRMVKNSEDYDADVIEYIKELFKKVEEDTKFISYPTKNNKMTKLTQRQQNDEDSVYTTNINLWWETVKSYIEELMGDDTDEILKCATQLQDYIDSFIMEPIFVYGKTINVVRSRKTFGDDFNEVIDHIKELKQNNKKIFVYMLYKVKDESGSFHYVIRYVDIEELK